MTTEAELRTWVSRGESETLEFKQRTSSGCLNEGTETACGMMNAKGGRVLYGVESDGHIAGQQVSDRTLESVSAALRRIEPTMTPEIEAVPIGDGRKSVVVVTTSRSHRRPHTFKGVAYMRVGNTTVALTREQYNEVLFEALHGTKRWENEPAEGVAIEDLDHSEIARTVEAAIRNGRLSEPGTRDPIDMLRGLGLLPEGTLLRAAVALFALPDRLATRYPQCRVRLARFRGTDKTEFIDNRQFHGNAFDLLERSDQFLRAHLPVAGRVVAGVFERTDDPMYPPRAHRRGGALPSTRWASGKGGSARARTRRLGRSSEVRGCTPGSDCAPSRGSLSIVGDIWGFLWNAEPVPGINARELARLTSSTRPERSVSVLTCIDGNGEVGRTASRAKR